MAKHKENRYKNVEELLIDLEALRDGRPPLRAHKRFDVSQFAQLGKGSAVEVKEKVYESQTIANYRMAILILSTVAVVFFLIIVVLLLR